MVMKVPLSWLRELVTFDAPISELRARLTMAGLEVEEVSEVGVSWRDVTIGRVVDLSPHPRRESLTVARVDLGSSLVTVVTGATNLHVDNIVPHVAPGGRLPNGDVAAREFAGVTSEGMVCSGDELDISPDRDRIYVLEPDAPVGTPLAEYVNETILDIYITTNRPDCMSMMGIAREVHALFGAPYTPAMLALLDPATARVDGSPGAPPIADVLRIRIDDSVGCPRFSASVVKNINIAPSPMWLQRRLHFAGVRPISNVVDVTNYVMLEVGQPLHAFDRARLGSSTILVRRAVPDEKLRTLDGEQRALTTEMMVVADEQRPRSLAGIMGGEDSEIAESTRDVVLEGASWDRASIRRASAALGLSTEASRRFGRGVDPDLTALGVARATSLVLELAGGMATAGLADEYPGRTALAPIVVRPEQIDALIGLHYPPAQVVDTLTALGFGVSYGDSEISERSELNVTVPGWRRFDVEGRADLAEEVGRIAGFNRVPATMLRGTVPAPRPDGDAGFADEVRARRTLAAAGLQEVITYSLVDPAYVSLLDGDPSKWLRAYNPQSVEQSVLRPSLLGSLLATLRSNLRQRDRALLFELARTWHGELTPLPDERRYVGIALSGRRVPGGWFSSDTEPMDFFDMKGVVEALCRAFRVSAAYAPAQHTHLHPGRTAALVVNGARIGMLGQLHPDLAGRFDMETTPVLVAEIDFEQLLRARQPLETVRTPSRFPPNDRDIALYVDESVPHAEVLRVIREAAGDLLESIELFDVYRGGSGPTGRKSLAFALRYRAPDRTIEEEEVARVHGAVEQAVQARLGAEVRGR
jgi:phenylalanyl-tRNA synthetase beta chain